MKLMISPFLNRSDLARVHIMKSLNPLNVNFFVWIYLYYSQTLIRLAGLSLRAVTRNTCYG